MLTWAAADCDGTPLHPSPILSQVRHAFPDALLEKVSPAVDWREAEHPEELLEPLLRELAPEHPTPSPLTALATLPALAPVVARWRQVSVARAVTALSPAAVERLYGAKLRASVSTLEQFAECPFKFFVAVGLRAEERPEFELDPRQRGSFLHRLLEIGRAHV